MHFLPYIIFLVFFLLLIKNRAWGFSFYLACRILLPPIVRVGPMSMNSIMAILLLIAVLVLDRKKKAYKKKELVSMVLTFVCSLAIVGLFATIPLDFQYKGLFQFFITELSPFISLVFIVRTQKDLRIILIALLCSYIIIGLWGIVTYVIKMNPLYTYFVLNYAGDYEVADYTGDGFDNLRGALTATASGNLSGPLPWGQESMLIALFLLFFNKKNKISKSLLLSVFALSSINTFLTGKRSCLLPIILFGAYYLWVKGYFTFRNIATSLGTLLLLYIIISFIPSLEGLSKNIESTIFFWNDSMASKNGISGSNMEMRQSQFEYAHQMVGNNILCGLGYDYPAFYSARYGSHPIMHGFESIYFNVLVSSGFIGIVIWIIFFAKLIRNSYMSKRDFRFVFAFHGGFILSCVLTAIQSSMWIYLILSMLFIKSNLFINETIDYNTNIQRRKIR